MKKTLIVILASVVLSSVALADGLSATLNVPILPGFGIASSLNYTFNIADNAVLGGSISPSYNPIAGFGLGSRVGGVYVFRLAEFDGGYIEAAVRAGINVALLPISPFVWSLDTGLELFGTQQVDPNIVLYGRGKLTIPLAPGFASGTSVGLNTGLKFELAQDLDAYAELGLLYPFGLSLSYDLTGSLYARLAPQVRAGVYTGFGSGGFKIGLAAEFIEKPQTIGTPGNYLP